jgi:hypothetical protein
MGGAFVGLLLIISGIRNVCWTLNIFKCACGPCKKLNSSF